MLSGLAAFVVALAVGAVVFGFADGVLLGDEPASVRPPVKSRCQPSYPDFCIPLRERNVDCDTYPGQLFKVVGRDPFDLDPDRNGVACDTPP